MLDTHFRTRSYRAARFEFFSQFFEERNASFSRNDDNFFFSLSPLLFTFHAYCGEINRPFHRYGGYIEFIRFKEYYGMPRGHLLSIYARFSGKKRTSMYISREKGDHYYIQTRRNDRFSHNNLFLGKLKKIGSKSPRKYSASLSDRAHAPWASHNTS